MMVRIIEPVGFIISIYLDVLGTNWNDYIEGTTQWNWLCEGACQDICICMR